MTEETAIRIAEAVESIVKATETTAFCGIIAIFFIAGIFVAMLVK